MRLANITRILQLPKLNQGAHVDPLNDITQSNAIQNYDMAVSGGNENGKFRASFLASSTPGFIQNNKLDKYIGTFSGSISSWIRD